MARVAQVTGKSDVPAEHHHVVDAVVEVFGNVRGPFSVLLHSRRAGQGARHAAAGRADGGGELLRQVVRRRQRARGGGAGGRRPPSRVRVA